MNNKLRTGLIVLIAVFLILATAIPALARTHPSSCTLVWREYDDSGESYVQNIPGEGELSISGDTLTKTCAGDIPLGEARTVWSTYFDLDDMRSYLCAKFGGAACNIGTPFTIGPDEMDGRQNTITYKGDELETDYWVLMVKNNGKFELVNVFTIE